jgi:ABC-type nickel/cobalt efflux system permease component RcnA
LGLEASEHAGDMKSKQLANVLIKIIGLYVCLCAIPGLVCGIAVVFARAVGAPQGNDAIAYVLPEAIGAAIQLVVGVILVVKSRNLAEFWFKNEDE